MRLGDIDDDDAYAAAVVLLELVNAGYQLQEGGSGHAAGNDDDRRA